MPFKNTALFFVVYFFLTLSVRAQNPLMKAIQEKNLHLVDSLSNDSLLLNSCALIHTPHYSGIVNKKENNYEIDLYDLNMLLSHYQIVVDSIDSDTLELTKDFTIINVNANTFYFEVAGWIKEILPEKVMTPLNLAISLGDMPIIMTLINKGAWLNKVPVYEGNRTADLPLLHTLRMANIPRDLLNSQSEHITELNRIKSQNLQVALLLIHNGAEVNVSGPYKNDTPLHYALRNTEIDFITKLFDEGASISFAENPNGTNSNTPLVLFAEQQNFYRYKSVNYTQILVEQGANPNIGTPVFNSLDNIFSYNGFDELLNHKIDPNLKYYGEKDSLSLLDYTIDRRAYSKVWPLMQLGADTTGKDIEKLLLKEQKQSVLCKMLENGYVPLQPNFVFKFYRASLKKRTQVLLEKQPNFLSAFTHAEKQELMNQAIDNKVRWFIKSMLKDTAFIYSLSVLDKEEFLAKSIEVSQGEIMQDFLESEIFNTSDISVVKKKEFLFKAIVDNYYQLQKTLLKDTLLLESLNEKEIESLYSYSDDHSFLRKSVQVLNPNITLAEAKSDTSLLFNAYKYAALEGDKEKMLELVPYFSLRQLYIPKFNSLSAFELSCKYADTTLIYIMLKQGCDINYLFPSGKTPLGYAITRYSKMLEFLLRHGANPNKASEGKLLIQKCVEVGNINSFVLLAEYGAYISKGKTGLPYELSHYTYNCEMLDFLTEYGVPRSAKQRKDCKKEFIKDEISLFVDDHDDIVFMFGANTTPNTFFGEFSVGFQYYDSGTGFLPLHWMKGLSLGLEYGKNKTQGAIYAPKIAWNVYLPLVGFRCNALYYTNSSEGTFALRPELHISIVYATISVGKNMFLGESNLIDFGRNFSISANIPLGNY